MSDIVLEGKLCRLRPYRLDDDPAAIYKIADDFDVARWMARRFPHPYRPSDAEEWIPVAVSGQAGTHFAIEVGGVYAGGIGYEPYHGERTGAAAFGYWLGRAFWDRGVTSEAARMVSDYALTRGGLRRLEATVFVENVASVRVLEKSGFVLEGTLRAYYLDRNYKVCDALLYARIKD